ncbi:MAG: hypothetical protein H0Z16_06735 [Thermodesulfobacterium sp.]|nr:hypothetical protein [Thermodesulfobacterium sp.]
MAEISTIRSLLEKRICWVGNVSQRGKARKIPIDFDGLLGAVLQGIIDPPNKINLPKKLKQKCNQVKTVDDWINIILEYLMQTKDVSSSHFPTILQKSEAPNYHFSDYRLTIDDSSKVNMLYWLLKFYYVELSRERRKVVVGVRTKDEIVENIIRDFRRVGSRFDFELNRGRVDKTILDKEITFYIPPSPSSTYFTLLSLLCAILQTFEYIHADSRISLNLDFEALVLSNTGGKKWSTVYHPIINLTRIYNIFFRPEELTENGKSKFIVFLESLLPPRLTNQNIIDSYYTQLSSLAFSILLEGYLNVHKLSQVISEKISLELRSKRENQNYKLGNIYYLEHVHTKFFGGDSMSEDFGKLRKQMIAIAFNISELAKKGDTQRSLLKRIILDLKNEETPVTFVEKLVSYLPRLEREGIKITLPQELILLPVREFFITKNEFIVILWNKYMGGGDIT